MMIKMLSLTFHGGVSEIGGNKILIQTPRTKLFLDFGLSFNKAAKYFEFPLLRPSNREDLFKTEILPKIKGLYQNQGLSPKYSKNGNIEIKGETEKTENINILLSHAHMDHYGYFGILRHDIPIFMSDISKRFLELKDHLGNVMWNTKIEGLNFKPLEKGKKIEIGDFEVRRFDVDHSVLGASGFILNAAGKNIAYTGDFRFHGHRRKLTEEFLKALKNVHIDYLICEGTRVTPPEESFSCTKCGHSLPVEENIEKHTLSSEKEVFERTVEICNGEDNLIIYDASPADLDRLRTIWKVAKKIGRKLIIDSRKSYLLLYMNKEKKLVEDLPDFGDFKIYLNRAKFQKSKILSEICEGRDIYCEAFEYGRLKHEAELTVKQQTESIFKKKPKSFDEYKIYYKNPYLFEIDTENFIWGPHGRDEVLRNSNEYILYTSNGPQTLLQFKPENSGIPGTYIYGKAEPFNEEMLFSFERLRNWLTLCGLGIDYAHTSGHCFRDELFEFIEEVEPDVLFPIHTEHPGEFLELGKRMRVEIVEEGREYGL